MCACLLPAFDHHSRSGSSTAALSVLYASINHSRRFQGHSGESAISDWSYCTNVSGVVRVDAKGFGNNAHLEPIGHRELR